MSITHLQHPASLTSLHQLHQPIHPHHQLMAAHQHHQQMMWHARSYESGIGIYNQQMHYLVEQPQEPQQTQQQLQQPQQQPIQPMYPTNCPLPAEIYGYHSGQIVGTDGPYVATKTYEEWTDDDNNCISRMRRQQQHHQQQQHSSSTNLVMIGVATGNRRTSTNSNPYNYVPSPHNCIQPHDQQYSSSLYCSPTSNGYGICLPKSKWHSENNLSLHQQHYEDLESEDFSSDSIDHDLTKNRFQNPIFTNFLRNRFNVTNLSLRNIEPTLNITTTSKTQSNTIRTTSIKSTRKSSFTNIRNPTDFVLPKKSTSTDSFFLENEVSDDNTVKTDKFVSDKNKIDQIYYENAKSKIDEHLDNLVKREGESTTVTSATVATTTTVVPLKSIKNRIIEYESAIDGSSSNGGDQIDEEPVYVKQNKCRTFQKFDEARKRLRHSFSMKKSG